MGGFGLTLAIFDLDNTLLNGDSDHAWGEFLVEEGIVDAEDYKRMNDRFYQEYLDGSLDVFHYQRFVLAPLTQHPMDQLERWRDKFMADKVQPMMQDKAARLLAVDQLIATGPELVNGRFTGAVAVTPSFQDGKVVRLNDWLAAHGENLDGAWFYSDSHHDLPLLRQVENPVAVDPDPTLEKIAVARGWNVMSLRD